MTAPQPPPALPRTARGYDALAVADRIAREAGALVAGASAGERAPLRPKGRRD